MKWVIWIKNKHNINKASLCGGATMAPHSQASESEMLNQANESVGAWSLRISELDWNTRI